MPIVQPDVGSVDEYGALMHAGRWGIHGISLPGRVTFKPGNVGFATFGAPRPMEVFEALMLFGFIALLLLPSCFGNNHVISSVSFPHFIRRLKLSMTKRGS